ncbi:hypothetical protein FSP39_002860 [Pinctada imbricata]|uniref:C-myc promoter-binding protein n=1 Tax=Pinctada imbricata TaxID=66713 RepID=A0AA88Y356_PINIB|nr:hypothetical protein FSP39_002860 [Pinctada imbricata]
MTTDDDGRRRTTTTTTTDDGRRTQHYDNSSLEPMAQGMGEEGEGCVLDPLEFVKKSLIFSGRGVGPPVICLEILMFLGVRVSMDEQRVADYFVVAGLPDNPLPLEEFSNESVIKPSSKQDPITDVAVIDVSLGEKPPKGYTCIWRTPTDCPANLNHGSIRCHDMFLCYRRGRDKPFLTDVGVLYEGKERLMAECEVVHTTPHGNPANVNNSSNGRIYVTYRRSRETAASDTLAVVDIVIVLANKNENPPHAYHKIEKNLNRGMVGSDVFICYKKAMVKADILAYKPAILDRYPNEDYDHFPLPTEVPQFCLPMGASIECWSAKAQHPLPVFSTFVLTLERGEKVYGAAVTFYEEYDEEKLTDLQMRNLSLKNKHIREQYRILKTVHANKCICLLSHWPFFDAFRKFLTYLYRISITGPHPVPIERHISHFMFDVPYPSPQRPRILVQLNHDAISLSMPEDSPLPHSGASFITMLKNLGPENCMSLLLYILLEQKILIHSLRPAVLTGVAEALATVIFPLQWQCAYIPLCPLGLSDMLSAPIPYIVGIDSRYFDLYDPPTDVVCVDLDTVTISLPEDKKNSNYRQLPKKPSRVLQDTLHKLFTELSTKQSLSRSIDEINLDMGPIDSDFKRKRNETLMELRIQESFLRFMACLMKGYKSYLKPITKDKALNNTATDASSLFDMAGFLKSRDKSNLKFFQQLVRTQTFISFISERSFVSNRDASLAFFDDCMEKVDENKDEPKLIEVDEASNSERTVFIMPPEPAGLPENVTYSYNGFPLLKSELFMRKQVSTQSLTKVPTTSAQSVTCRTKQEVKNSQKIAQHNSGDSMLWAKTLLGHCYCLWFIHLPAYIQYTNSATKCMNTAYNVLQRMHHAKLQKPDERMHHAKLQKPDEVCYRIMLHLCGQYNLPVMAVKVLYQMKRAGVQPNAITYGYYNKAVLEGTWPTTKSKATIAWRKIRNVIIGVAQFRRAIRRRSLSLYSNSGSEYDQMSLDSFQEETSSDRGIFKPDMNSENKNSSQREKSNLLTVKNGSTSSGVSSEPGMQSSTSSIDNKPKVVLVDTGDNEKADIGNKTENKTIHGLRRFSHPHNSRKKENSVPQVDQKKRTDNMIFTEVNHDNFRSRVGSIVRKSLGSVGSSGSHETLQGSIMTNSQAGLLMLSQSNLDKDFPGETENQTQEPGHSRKRHRSAGDYHTKSKPVHILSNWRPRHISGDPYTNHKGLPEILGIDAMEDDCFMEENEKSNDFLITESSDRGNVEELSENVNNNNHGSMNVNDSSFNNLDDSNNLVIDDLDVSGNENLDSSCKNDEHSLLAATKSDPCDIPMRRNDSFASGRSGVLSPISYGTPVTENDPLGFFNKNDSIVHDDVDGRKKAEECEIFDADGFSFSGHEVIPNFTSESSENDNTKKNFVLGSGASLDHYTPNTASTEQQPLSPTEKIGKMLRDVGRTNSSPGNLDSQLDSMDGRKERSSWLSSMNPVKGYIKSLHSLSKKSQESLDESPNSSSASESRFKRLGSFKKSERLSGALKYMSSALTNKFQEIKQTIGTPGSYGSNMSLTEDGGDEHRQGIDVPRRSGSVDHTPHRPHVKEIDSLGVGSLPNQLHSSSFMEQYVPLKEFGETKSVHFTDLESDFDLYKISVETEASSCCRCGRCRSLLYDEEIMAGWSADDSNLNTSCYFCQKKLVPKLQIYIKDWRGIKHSALVDKDDLSDIQSNSTADPEVLSSHSNQDPWVLNEKTNSMTSLDNPNAGFFFGEDGIDSDIQHNYKDSPESASKDSHLAKAAAQVEFEGVALSARRRCASECFTTTTDGDMFSTSFDSMEGFPGLQMKSPLSISIDEEMEMPSGPAPFPEMKKDYMESRCTTSVEPITVPYLSPLVLRKELENIMAAEGDLSLASDTFVDQHPIIYWNLVWYFKRLEVPSHIPGFLTTSKSLGGKKENEGVLDCHHVLIRPLWDNLRIHEEVGLPMYKSWNEGHSSHTVDALLTEAQPFNRAFLHQIITSIQCNDLLTPIKLVMNYRRRLRLRKCHHRSMYRDILFLAFTACGRDNIDNDAFDREFRLAFQKLAPMEMKRTQRDDRPRKTRVIWCRKVFGELEV